MIIAAYAGTGKSTFAAQIEDTADLPIMPYRWILPPVEKAPAELEGEKGALYRLADPRFPQNYLAEVLKAEKLHRFVLIPTNIEAIDRLEQDYGRKVLLCYPSDACREEYRARFAARGNSESFLELFVDGWDRFLEPVRQNGQGVHIVMGPEEYLTDLRQRFEVERRNDLSAPVSAEAVRALEAETAAIRTDSVLYLSGGGGCCFYPITDLDAPKEREFLSEIGRTVLDGSIDLVPLIAPKSMFKTKSVETFWTESQENVKAFVEKHRYILSKTGNGYGKRDH